MILFDKEVEKILKKFKEAPSVKNERWQSVVAPQPSREILNHTVKLLLPNEDLEFYRRIIKPNVPWADSHFELERVSGEPINPGTTWREWPYAGAAALHRRPGAADPKFDHSYAERYWPKLAGLEADEICETFGPLKGHAGIRFMYGDLDDLVTVLSNEPTTRQAYLPVWFPEDLSACLEHKRVPCSLGYHFIMRDNKLHVVYPMRSCDFVRHFRDDVYLTIRLLLWVLSQCRLACPENDWDQVLPGSFTMHITSLHIFESDVKILGL